MSRFPIARARHEQPVEVAAQQVPLPSEMKVEEIATAAVPPDASGRPTDTPLTQPEMEAGTTVDVAIAPPTMPPQLDLKPNESATPASRHFMWGPYEVKASFEGISLTRVHSKEGIESLPRERFEHLLLEGEDFVLFAAPRKAEPLRNQ